MKKSIFPLLIALVLCSLLGCQQSRLVPVEENAKDSNELNSTVDESIVEATPEPTPILSREEQAEIEATEFFSEEVVDKVNNNENVMGGRALEDLAKEFPDNFLINNYNNFFNAYFYYHWYNDFHEQDDYDNFEYYLSLVEIPFDGEYSDLITDFIEGNMGMDRYYELRGENVEQEQIYKSLSEEDKVEILVTLINLEDSYGDNISDEQYDALVEQVAAEYGITSLDIQLLFTDGDILERAYTEAANNNINNSETHIVTGTGISYPRSSGSGSNSATFGERNALSSAKDYLACMAFSYSGLIEQLEFEGFSYDEAKYAADNCGADWYEQAALSASEYLNIMSYSRSGLIDQLEFEGFTYDQAVYGVEANGY